MAESFLPATMAESAGLHALPGEAATAQAIRAAQNAGGRSLETTGPGAWIRSTWSRSTGS